MCEEKLQVVATPPPAPLFLFVAGGGHLELTLAVALPALTLEDTGIVPSSGGWSFGADPEPPKTCHKP